MIKISAADAQKLSTTQPNQILPTGFMPNAGPTAFPGQGLPGFGPYPPAMPPMQPSMQPMQPSMHPMYQSQFQPGAYGMQNGGCADGRCGMEKSCKKCGR